jgi:hypothetical protein
MEFISFLLHKYILYYITLWDVSYVTTNVIQLVTSTQTDSY